VHVKWYTVLVLEGGGRSATFVLKIPGAIMQNLVTPATRRPAFVQPWFINISCISPCPKLCTVFSSPTLPNLNTGGSFPLMGGEGIKGHGRKINHSAHLVSRLTMSGVKLLLPYTPAWRGSDYLLSCISL